MRKSVLATGLIAIVALSARATPADQAVSLRPLPLREGIRDILNPGDDPKKLVELDLYKRAKKAGIDLRRAQPDPVVAHSYEGGRLFYVFFKTVEEAFADRPYVIQRIKRTERNWETADADPEVKVTYQVETFKLLAGAQKRGDQHYGSYSLKGLHRREIVKEYEIGFGEVPGKCEGTAWPYANNSLFKYIAKYGPDHTDYDATTFHRSTTWSLTVSLDADGGYVVRAPELGIDAPEKVTDSARTIAVPDAASEDIVLVRGEGIEGTRDAKDIVKAMTKTAGTVIADEPAPNGNRNVCFERKLVAYVEQDGSLRNVRTRPGFAGRTKEGARVGDTRTRIVELYGLPRRQYSDAGVWTYAGIGFWFDGHDRVVRMYVTRL